MISLLAFLALSGATSEAAQLYRAAEQNDKIDNSYIVMLKDPSLHSALRAANETAYLNDYLDSYLLTVEDKMKQVPKLRAAEGEEVPSYTVNAKYSGVPGLTGFSATLSPEELALLLSDEAVDYVEEDQMYHMSQTCLRQSTNTWGLPRTTTRSSIRSTNYDYHNLNFAGVEVYVFDTGIRRDHNEFGGRALFGADTTTNNPPRNDPQGHGTHCAGTVGGRLFGVAKGVTLIDVRVLDAQGSGSNTGIINGINWAANRQRNLRRTGIANLSLGGGFSAALNNALNAATGAGILMVTASGNERQNNCNVSPGSASSALNVNAADINDNHASFSNWGRCSQIYAPGVDIRSAGIRSATQNVIMSGTSMAAPHVAGVAAKMLARNRALTAAQLRAQVLNTGVVNAMRSTLNSANRYVFMACP